MIITITITITNHPSPITLHLQHGLLHRALLGHVGGEVFASDSKMEPPEAARTRSASSLWDECDGDCDGDGDGDDDGGGGDGGGDGDGDEDDDDDADDYDDDDDDDYDDYYQYTKYSKKT